LKRANEKMADIYAELTGKDRKSILAKMKEDKPMSADDARKWGFVGSVIELQKLAAFGGDKPQTMETVKEKRTIEVSRVQALSALVDHKIEIEIDVDAEAAKQISAYAEEVKALKADADELKADVEAKNEAINTVKAQIETLESSKATADAKVAELTAKVAEHEATIASMKTTPIAPKVGPKGSAEPVVPGDDNEAPVKYKKQTAEERRAAMAQMLKA